MIHNSKLSCKLMAIPWLLLLLMISSHVVSGKDDHTRRPRTLHTIMTEEGDIVDCVKIYEQPAFSHPLLKDHKIQLESSDFQPMASDALRFQQSWNRKGSCPVGTIPVLRSNDEKKNITIPTFFHPGNVQGSDARQEEASAFDFLRGPFRGTRACLSLHESGVRPNEFSFTYLAVGAGSNDPESTQKERISGSHITTTLAAGWAAYPLLFGDGKFRLFVFLKDDHSRTASFNLDSGFVQTSKEYLLGSTCNNTSVVGDKEQTYCPMDIKQDDSNNWWIHIGNDSVGYWPAKIFTNFERADVVQWGGLVLNTKPNGGHTNTFMGSGRHTSLGFGYAAFIGGIATYTDKRFGMQPLAKPNGYSISYPNCYGVSYAAKGASWVDGFFMYYGGPGGIDCDLLP